jgi:hypothetical protein
VQLRYKPLIGYWRFSSAATTSARFPRAWHGVGVVGAQAGLVDRQGAATDSAAAPVIAKYTGVLAAADVFTASTTFWVMESIRLDLGYGSQVHP